MKWFRKILLDPLEFLPLFLIYITFKMLPVFLSSAIGGVLARCIGPLLPVHKIGQENVAKALRGRIFGIQNMIMSLAFTLPPLAIAYVADLQGIQMGFIGLGVLAAVIFVLQFAIPSVQRLR